MSKSNQPLTQAQYAADERGDGFTLFQSRRHSRKKRRLQQSGASQSACGDQSAVTTVIGQQSTIGQPTARQDDLARSATATANRPRSRPNTYRQPLIVWKRCAATDVSASVMQSWWL